MIEILPELMQVILRSYAEEGVGLLLLMAFAGMGWRHRKWIFRKILTQAMRFKFVERTAVALWLDDLNGDSPAQRQHAADWLAHGHGYVAGKLMNFIVLSDRDESFKKALDQVAHSPKGFEAVCSAALDTGRGDDIRKQAIAALGRRRSPRAVQALEAVLVDKSEGAECRRFAVEALREIPGVPAANAFGRAFDPDVPPGVQSAAAECLNDGFVDAPMAVVRDFIKANGSPRHVVERIVQWLGESKEFDESETLIECIEHDDPVIRKTAMMALQGRRAQRAIRCIQQRLHTELDDDVRKSGFLAIRNLNGVEGQQALLDLRDGHGDQNVRAWFAEQCAASTTFAG